MSVGLCRDQIIRISIRVSTDSRCLWSLPRQIVVTLERNPRIILIGI